LVTEPFALHYKKTNHSPWTAEPFVIFAIQQHF